MNFGPNNYNYMGHWILALKFLWSRNAKEYFPVFFFKFLFQGHAQWHISAQMNE